MARLVFHIRPGESTVHELENSLLTIGRCPDNAIVLKDGSVSGHHAEIGKQDDIFLLRDLNSTNGTMINGERIQSVELRDGNIISLGSMKCEFQNDSRFEPDPLQIRNPVKQPAIQKIIGGNFGRSRLLKIAVLIIISLVASSAVLLVNSRKKQSPHAPVSHESSKVAATSHQNEFQDSLEAFLKQDGGRYTQLASIPLEISGEIYVSTSRIDERVLTFQKDKLIGTMSERAVEYDGKKMRISKIFDFTSRTGEKGFAVLTPNALLIFTATTDPFIKRDLGRYFLEVLVEGVKLKDIPKYYVR